MNALFILAVIHMADFGSPTPDRYEAVYAYDTLSECWEAAAVESETRAYDMSEAVVVCLPAQL